MAAEREPEPLAGPREEIPKDVESRLNRGREGLKEVEPRRLLGIEFANNNHFAELNEERTKIVNLSTTAIALGGEKPDHRVRRSNEIVAPMLQRKISMATQREPDWESVGATRDQSDYEASRIALNVARAGYHQWGFPTAEEKALWFAMVTEEAFGRPVWDSTVGPYEDVSVHPEADYVDPVTGERPYEGMPDPDNPKWRGKGDIKVMVYSGLEVIWEPGVDFEDSRWYAVEHARPVDVVESEEGFIHLPNEKLRADARDARQGHAVTRDLKGANLVLVTEYFERPCARYPKGRLMTFANGRKIFPDDEYPVRDQEGKVVDEPPLRRLIWDIDGSSDRAKGLVQEVVDTVRSYDQAINKQAEYSQIGLVAQLMAPEGVLLTDPTDEPGLVIEYDRTLAGGEVPQWREAIPFPRELFEMEERARRRFSDISFDQDIPPGVESGKAIGEVAELNRTAWQRFIDRFNTWRSQLMSDCLVIAQQKYGPDRIMRYRGTSGWETIENFQGADIRGQTDVRVRVTAAQTQTRAQIEQRILQLAQIFPGVFSPEVVIEAINSANPEKLIQGYEEDVGRAQRAIAQLKAGTFWKQPDRPALPGEEAITAGPDGRPMVPGWLPRPFDSLPIIKAVMESWMKTDDWESQDPKVKDASLLYYQKLIDLEAEQAQRQMEQQTQVAEEQGMLNAAKESGPKTPPSQPTDELPPPPNE